jgi:acyl-CoA thioester hydrolase
MVYTKEINIRFSDVDAFGHVNNACYLTYIEEARIDFFEKVVGYDYDWSKEGVILARAEIDFIVPAHYKDQVYIRTSCRRIGTKSFDLAYEMYKMKEDKEILLCSGTTVIVMFDYDNNRSIPVPEEWRKLLKIEH